MPESSAPHVDPRWDLLRAVRQKPAVLPLADAIVVKDRELFFLCPPTGRIPLEEHHGFGLYYHDCRYLDGYDLHLSGLAPTPLAASAAIGFEAALELTNPEFETVDGRVLPKETLGIHWARLVDGHELALHDRITLENYSLEAVDIALSLAFRAGFQDVFQVRGLLAEQPGRLHQASWRGGVLAFAYEGADGLWRELGVHLAPDPTVHVEQGAAYRVPLGARGRATVEVSLVVSEERLEETAAARIAKQPDPEGVRRLQRRSAAQWLAGQTRFHSDDPSLNAVVQRSLRDLRLLRSGRAGGEYFSAGLPWYGALFGRDSAITAIETLAFDPRIATETLRLLAAHQGRVVDEFREEEPGKILHELRVGELAHLGRVPHSPYFGTVDATPLFLILLGHHAAWTGDLSLFRELREPVVHALHWMDAYADLSGNGWLEYRGRGEHGVTNEGWKDSPDCIMTEDGTLAAPPIALVEAQAYAWQAKLLMADLFRRDDDVARADELARQAGEQRDRFERAFWMEDLGCYALALEQGVRPCRVVASNPGHALWTGIAPRNHARTTARRLMAPDMFSGWGIRTLSSKERRYNPIGYHLGTVWPHDNALIGAGFRRYGLDREAAQILSSLVDAATAFPHDRLPELFTGFERTGYTAPVSYPVACHPQAWSAASVPYLVVSLLGLEPDGFGRRLRLVRPVMPSFVHELELRGLRVAGAEADLRFERPSPDSALQARVLDVRGDLEVVVEP
ncbi:MAG: glycogen debranching N-terminal domain-containing protein [Candidatus Limnocylindrales bacterium]